MDYVELLNSLPGACAQGIIWGIMAIGVFITYKILDFPDMTVDGTMCTGGAVCVVMMMNGYSVWTALALAFCVGLLAGLVTGFLHTVMGIPPILAGILTQLSLYTVNLRIMGSSNVALSRFIEKLVNRLEMNSTIIITCVFVGVLIAILYWFFGTEIGCSMRATGTNNAMAKAQGINTNLLKVLGLMISNGIVALCSGMYAQYLGSADINMGRGAIAIGLAAVIISEVIFGKLFKNFALKLAGVVLGAVLYYVIIQIVVWMGLETEDMKLLTAMVVAIFLSVPYLKSKYFTKPKAHNHADTKGGEANA